MALKTLTGDSCFTKGPINLGTISRPVNAIACVYLLFVCAIAVMPNAYPITSASLNYSPVAWGVVAILALIAW